MTIKRYASTAGGNNIAGTGNGFMAEGIPPSGVNDAYRQFQANVREMANQLPWVDVGSLGQAANEAGFIFVSSNSIEDSSGVDLTATYKKGRRIRFIGSVTGDINGTITDSVFSSPNNAVTISLDGGASLTNEALQIFLGPNLDTAFNAPIGVEVFNSSGTWNKPAGLRRIKITAIGGGAAGGGAVPSSSGRTSVGSGGGSGGIITAIIGAGSLSDTEAVVIGSGGTGVSGANGNSGGNTSFGGTLVVANGGSGGNASASNLAFTLTNGGNPGSTSNSAGDVLFEGGYKGADCSSEGDVIYALGHGAVSLFGSGSRGEGGSASSASDADIKGAGGGGSSNRSTPGAASNRAGGNGEDGVIIIEEYFS